MFKHLITVRPLGLLYGSAGAFLSPDNLVGRSGAKFPPDAATLAGLFFGTNKQAEIAEHETLRQELHVAGPFWAKSVEEAESFYVPIPKHRIVAAENEDEWHLDENRKWQRQKDPKKQDLESEYRWQRIDAWSQPTQQIRRESKEAVPWRPVTFLHPQMQSEQRHVLGEGGLFLESAMQMDEETCLVYLATHALPEGWYRFGGEGHMVEVSSQPIQPESTIFKLLNTKIQRAFALITPGVWGSKNLSYRYPRHPDFPRAGMHLLTDKAVPFRYRIGHRATQRGRLGRGRYGVPAGSVYVLKQPLEKTWWEFPEDWFPKEGFPLKHLGCGLSLPVEIQGLT